MSGFTWEQRIERAEKLKKEYPTAAELLEFYWMLARYQTRMSERLAIAPSLEIRDLMADLAGLFLLVHEYGTPALRNFLDNSANINWLSMLIDYWNSPEKEDTGPADFFLRALLQPYAETLAGRADLRGQAAGNRCPLCNAKPQLGILRPEGDGARLSLMCLLCATEWPHVRVACVNCGELDKEKLPVYQAHEFPTVRLNMCETCQTYLKCIDLTKDGLAIPPVDDLATVSLSMWALGQGYHPARTNLFGF